MILDVGCGTKPRGNVNVDLLIEDDDYRDTIRPKNISNFVKASCLHLPFKDSSFDVVVCSHLLEHLEKPEDAIQELLRVSKIKVIVIVPFGLFEMVSWILKPWKFFWRRKHHKRFYWLNPFQTRNVRLNFISLKDAALNRPVFNHDKLKFPIPFETETVFWKNQHD